MGLQGTSVEAPMNTVSRMRPTPSAQPESSRATSFTARWIACACLAAGCALLSAQVCAQGYAGNGMALPGKQAAQPKLTLVAGETPANASGDKRGNEWKAYGSYQFTETWGAEFNYLNWGRAGGLAGPKSALPAAAGAPAGMVPRGSQLDVSATGTMPLTRGLSLFGKFGYGRNEISASPYCLSAACGPLGAARREGARAGVGLRYSFSDSWGLRLDYENTNSLADPAVPPAKGDSWSARIRYTF